MNNEVKFMRIIRGYCYICGKEIRSGELRKHNKCFNEVKK